jgi:tetratricopeptide (TPR) repeat protein
VTEQVIQNRYEVVRLLGSGGTGRVFLVRDRHADGRELALKVLDDVKSAPDLADHLRHEFRLLAHLHHPNLVEVYDFGFDAELEAPFFTQEYVQGYDLLEAGRILDFPDFLLVVVQVLRGLEYIHSRGFVHRDLKPPNVLVRTVEGRPEARILDLSLADTGRPEGETGIKGSVHYLAPEVLRGGEVDHRADIYSLGVTLYHVLEGELPFSGSSTRLVLQAHLEKEIPPLTRPDHEAFSRVLRKMTAKNPAHRHSSANEVIEDVNQKCGTSFALQTRETRLSYTRTLGLLGRREAQEALAAALKPSQESGERVFFLEGAAGSGKTRLLEEFRHLVQMANVHFVAGHPPRRLDTPYWCFQGALEQIVSLVGPDSSLLSGYETSVARLCPRLARFRPLPPAGKTLDASRKLRFHSEISRFVLAAAAQVPLCLCFDDFDAADQGTFELVGSLIRSLGEAMQDRSGPASTPGQAPIAIVLSYDPADLPPQRREAIEKNHDSPFSRRIVLANLDRPETARLLTLALGHADIPDAFADKVFEYTAGNPGLVVSSLESLLESGGLVQSGGQWRFDAHVEESFTPPRDAVSFLLRRFQALPRDARGALRVLAAASAALPGPLLGAVLDRCDFDSVAALTRLLAEGLVLRRALSGEVLYTLADPAFSEIAAELSDGPTDLELYAVMGEETERYFPAPSFEVVARLANYFRHAGLCERALDYSARAAEGFAQLGAFPTALRQYSEALEIIDRAEDSHRTVELLFQRAGVHRVLGRFEGALEDLEEALRLAEDNRSPSEVAHALTLLAELNLQWGKFFLTDVLGNRAYALAQDTKDRENLLRAEITLGTLAVRRGEYALAEERLGRAEELAQELSRHEERAKILMERAGTQVRLGRSQEALHNLESARNIFEEAGHAQGISRCLASIGNIHFLMGEYDEALSRYRHALRIHKESGDIDGTISVNYSIGNILYQIGLFPPARKYFEASLGLSRTFNLPDQVARNMAGLAQLSLGEGRLGTALTEFGRSLEQYEAIGARSGACWAENGIGGVFLKIGELDRARDVLERTAREVEETGEIRIYCEVLMNLARLQMRLGNMDEAERRARLALEFARKGSLRNFELTFKQVSGEIALARSDFEGAVRSFGRAFDLAKDMQVRVGASEANIFLGKVLLALGQPREALEKLEKGLAPAMQGQYNELLYEGAVTAGEAEFDLGNHAQAAYRYRQALERLERTLADLPPEHQQAFLSDKQEVFDRAQWLAQNLRLPTHPS